MNTKGLSGDEIAKYTKLLNMDYKEGRSELAPEVHELTNKQKCTRFNSTSSKITHKVRIKENQRKENQQPLNQLQMHKTNCKCGCQGCWLFCSYNERA